MTITIEPTFFFVFVVAVVSLLLGTAIGASRVYKAAYQTMSEFLDLSKKVVVYVEQELTTNKK